RLWTSGNVQGSVRARGRARVALLAALVLASSPLWAESEAEPLLPLPRSASAPFSFASGPNPLLVRVYANAARVDEFVEIGNPGLVSVDLIGRFLMDWEETGMGPM